MYCFSLNPGCLIGMSIIWYNKPYKKGYTLQGTNISPKKWHFESMIFQTSPGGICIRSLEGNKPYNKQSMYGIFTYIYHQNQPNVGKYTIHGSYGRVYHIPIDLVSSEISKSALRLRYLGLDPPAGAEEKKKCVESNFRHGSKWTR